LKKHIDNSQSNEPTLMYNVKVMGEQLQCASVYKEPALISENYSLLFFALFQSLSNINNTSLELIFLIYFVCLYLICIKTNNIKVMNIL